MKALLTLPLLVSCGLFSAVAHADVQQACLDASAQGQTLRNAHQLAAARDELRICAQANCPTLVQRDCAEWLQEVERALPTVVFSAKDRASHDLVDVAVSVDGKPVTSRLDGRAVPLDAGPHTIAFATGEGAVATEQVLVKEGDKYLNIGAVLLKPGEASLASGAQAAPLGSSTQAAGEGPHGHALGGQKIMGLAAAGLGGVGLVLGAIFGSSASAHWATATAACPTFTGCSALAMDSRAGAVSAATSSTASYILGGALLAAGVTLYLTAPGDEKRPVAVLFTPLGLGLVGRF